ncbi:hypothetical protein DTO006G1_2719 [Penicillium roqueforti]|uniref:N2227-like n=1 Tax=Penicillium roqueforti (strain FM164) TaxID=1365484 RepID=W6PVC6_PENRF|nr:uncharacterized protein LCP9604111_1673 [Penicillium roqueforti]CDM28193.1 N2227-like [Penicillium roqueforti FM164]KAF9251677.1 hypothetical protein LCP9604111_1673 [Penicillium roqueforti]KAI1836510.1 hypothetical protein CBS147337_2737 [Penicillium roqueforti]KAI2685352.1 hypothetical protein LCP963914a_4679 [Penicillium roqueforti]KAI2690292.1 hypothetical protein CBS147355_743 [Penicillium roqueforti]
MRTSIYISRFIALLLCIAFPLYLAIRGSASLSDIAVLLSSLSERAEALHVELTSPLTAPLAAPPAPISGGAFEASAEPAKPRKRYSSLPNGLAHCINSFEQYPFLAEQVLQRKHARYSKQTPAQKAISNKLGYPAHFEKARKGVEVNARFSEKIAQIAREDYHTGPRALEDNEDAEFGVVDLAFGHLSRDWSTQGVKERQAVFPPVLDGLEQHFGGNGRGNKVLVPGSGMGRLASDIADIGYDVTANELDYGSILAYRLLTNHTTSLHQHTLQPFVTKWTYQANPSSRYSALTVPDHWPNKAVKLVEGDFLEMFPEDGEFDAVVTLFFIDISKNVIDFLGNIHRLLKPGGVWINLGPLKWGSHTALQLSAEEVLQLADLLGFDVDYTSRKSIDSLYAEQPETLLKFTYVTQFWSATKRE